MVKVLLSDPWPCVHIISHFGYDQALENSGLTWNGNGFPCEKWPGQLTPHCCLAALAQAWISFAWRCWVCIQVPKCLYAWQMWSVKNMKVKITISPNWMEKDFKRFQTTNQICMELSWNRGTPKSSMLIGFSLVNHPFWGTTIYGNPIYVITFNISRWSITRIKLGAMTSMHIWWCWPNWWLVVNPGKHSTLPAENMAACFCCIPLDIVMTKNKSHHSYPQRSDWALSLWFNRKHCK